jgi:hypothetical protein
MDSAVFRAALRASAKVALTATLSSCGGSIQTHTDDTPDAIADASRAATLDVSTPVDAVPDDVILEASVDVATDDAVADAGECRPPPMASLFPEQSHPGVTISDDVFDCCVTLLASELGTDGQAPQLTDAQAHDPTFLGCCAATIYRLDNDYFDGGRQDFTTLAEAGLSIYSTLYVGCCENIPPGNAVGPTCSPWGPPMPPAMPEVA